MHILCGYFDICIDPWNPKWDVSAGHGTPYQIIAVFMRWSFSTTSNKWRPVKCHQTVHYLATYCTRMNMKHSCGCFSTATSSCCVQGMRTQCRYVSTCRLSSDSCFSCPISSKKKSSCIGNLIDTIFCRINVPAWIYVTLTFEFTWACLRNYKTDLGQIWST